MAERGPSASGRLRTAAWLLLLAGCGRPAPEPVTAETWVGDATCIGCHSEQAAFAGTAHQLTSTHPTSATIRGSFRDGENILRTINPSLYYRMDERDGEFFQTAVLGREPDTSSITERFGIVIGSGRKGQSYLYWHGEGLYQLPVSFWTELDDWIQSPGYVEGVPRFDRRVLPRCLECHTTYFSSRLSSAPNQYERGSEVLGITCETCHGSGREHIERQAAAWRVRLLGQGILNPARLARGRQLDACALCHGGIGELVGEAFGYLPDRPLGDHVRRPALSSLQPIDVHGNQVALLGQSPCFQATPMTCATCHNVHETQRDPGEFSATCLSCHEPKSCGLFHEHGSRLLENCVGCHMPELPANTVVAIRDGRPVRPTVRSHWIRIYQDDELREAVGVPF